MHKQDVLDTQEEGYKADIKTQPEEFLNTPEDALTDVASSIAALPRKRRHSVFRETEPLVINRIAVIYRQVPAMLYNIARAQYKRRMLRLKPKAQLFLMPDGKAVKADTNPAYAEALEIWRDEMLTLENDIAMAVSMFSGLVLLDGMPEDESWVDQLTNMTGSFGLEFNSLFKSPLFDEEQVKELLYKQLIVLGNSTDLENFTKFQASGDRTQFTANEAAASAMFQSNKG